MFVKAQGSTILKYPAYPSDLLQENPDTSFVFPLEDQDLSSYGFFPVTYVPSPGFDFKTEKVEEGEPTLVGGEWTQTWNVVELTPEEQQEIVDNQEAYVESEIFNLLRGCDYTQLPDFDGDQVAWTAYRQQLRDIPSQPGYPWNVTFPTPPTP